MCFKWPCRHTYNVFTYKNTCKVISLLLLVSIVKPGKFLLSEYLIACHFNLCFRALPDEMKTKQLDTCICMNCFASSYL